MKKQLFRFASMFAGLAIVVAACGGAGTSPSASQPAESVTPSEAAFPTANVALTLWTKEGEADGSLQFVQKLATDYNALHSNVTIEVVNKDVEALREDFQTASLAGEAPELLWTVADHIGPFTAADLILPLTDLIDRSKFVPAAADIVTVDGTLWGAPVSFGNQLMLYWNKDLAGADAPADSDAWVAKAKELTTGDQFGIVFNQTESFWLVPFLGGFGGRVFADDGVTPTLNTDAMKSALQFLYDLKYTDKVAPSEADYNVADGLFKDGKAPYIINGDWTLGAYADTFGDKLGVGPLPAMTGGEDPKPYIAGAFLMVSKAAADDADTKAVVTDFLWFATSTDNQVAMVTALKRLPGDADAIADPVVTGDDLLAGAAEAAQKGIPQPTNLEMRCVFDSMTAGVRDLFTGNSDVAGIANTMQSSAETCITQLG
ncbi:MAG TPA: extracellular solute-binding protein [Candidatus Limnocylindrales bacterium]|jgi:arabinogalactan oligomer/maltooligosaccharide transport system substrate-binding protein|nr:extracellular solute-binding protein [Candidatus Limnocylindrales bacterium]